jgi:hypothetical protein
VATTETHAPNRRYTIIAMNNLKQTIEDTLASATEPKPSKNRA